MGRFHTAIAISALAVGCALGGPHDRGPVSFDAPARGLGLRGVYDFRTENEKENAPDRLDPGVEYVALPIFYPSMDPDHLRGVILRGGGEEGYFEDLLERANRSFALDNTAQIAALLESLSEPGALPALFHCTYGKDRTGFAAALILEILGVPPETASQDYLLSNDYLASEIDRMSRLIWLGSFFRIPRSESRELLGVQREYIDSAREAMLGEFGSLEAYVRDGLGVPDATVERLRAVMLEPATGLQEERPALGHLDGQAPRPLPSIRSATDQPASGAAGW